MRVPTHPALAAWLNYHGNTTVGDRTAEAVAAGMVAAAHEFMAQYEG